MENIEIRKELTAEEYNLFTQHARVSKEDGNHILYFSIDEFMGFTKCKIIVDENHQISYEETFVFGKDLPFKTCIDSRILRFMNDELNILFKN